MKSRWDVPTLWLRGEAQHAKINLRVYSAESEARHLNSPTNAEDRATPEIAVPWPSEPSEGRSNGNGDVLLISDAPLVPAPNHEVVEGTRGHDWKNRGGACHGGQGRTKGALHLIEHPSRKGRANPNHDFKRDFCRLVLKVSSYPAKILEQCPNPMYGSTNRSPDADSHDRLSR